MGSPLKMKATLNIRPEAMARVKRMLAGAPTRVHNHRVSVGIHEQEASAQPVKVASRQPRTNAPKRDYSGAQSAAKLIDVAMFHEFGTARVPERSWLRSWFDRNLDRLKQDATEAMRAEYSGNKEAMPALAARWYEELRQWIAADEAKLTPLSARTKQERAAAGLPEDPPLYATHQLVEAIRGLADGRYV